MRCGDQPAGLWKVHARARSSGSRARLRGHRGGMAPSPLVGLPKVDFNCARFAQRRQEAWRHGDNPQHSTQK